MKKIIIDESHESYESYESHESDESDESYLQACADLMRRNSSQVNLFDLISLHDQQHILRFAIWWLL